MYGLDKKSKKTVQQIVENINDVAETSKKGKVGYIKTGKAKVKMPDVDSDVGEKLGEFAEKQVKKAKSSSKKIAANIE